LPLSPAAERILRLKLAVYDATIRYVDRTIGRTMQQLADWRLDESTLVTVLADHGEEFLDHAAAAHAWDHDPRDLRAVGHGQSHFQELLHVPWLAVGPGVPAGVRFKKPVSLCDFAPTVTDWLGLDPFPLPPEPVSGSVGRSVAPDLLAPADAPADRILLAEAIAYGPDLVAVRQGDWKLIARRSGEPLGLYDLAADPGEQTDLTAARPDVARRLQEHLGKWRAALGDDRDRHGGADGKPARWTDVDATVRRRLKELGYTDD
jgi:arylsulfatase A-like enzyme